MSTKIYNGIKFKSKNISKVLSQLISIKKEAKEISKNLITKRDLELFIRSNNLQDLDPFEIVRELFLAMEVKENSNRWHFVPRIDFTVFIYPTKEGDIYGYYQDSNRPEYQELLKPFYTDFHYQNNSDRPSDITEEEWEFRRNKWDELIDYKFKDTGFTYELVSQSDLDIFDFLDVVKDIISYLKRDIKIEKIGIDDQLPNP